MYAQASRYKVSQLYNCIGFINCTKIQMSRPGGVRADQRTCYFGQKRFHCLIYQSITSSDGLMFYLYGPEVGRRHYMTLYRQSRLILSLQGGLVTVGNKYCLYGDAAYHVRPCLQTAFSLVGATLEQATYSSTISAQREAVEWPYKHIKLCFASHKFKLQLKVRQAPVALFYEAVATFWNFKIFMGHGEQVDLYFDSRRRPYSSI